MREEGCTASADDRSRFWHVELVVPVETSLQINFSAKLLGMDA